MPSPQKLLLLLISGTILGLSSCKDDLSSVGKELMPESEFFAPKVDTSTPLHAKNTLGSIRSDDASFALIGTYYDPLFGTVKADFITQMFPALLDNDIKKYAKSDLIMDTLYLIMPFAEKTWKGDSSALHRLRVYELNTFLNEEKYYSDFDVTGKYNSEFLAEKLVKAADGYNVKTKIGEGTTARDTFLWNSQESWKIAMPQELAARFWEFSTNSDYPLSRTAFLNYFKGIYVTSELESSGKTSIIPININQSQYNIQFKLNYRKIVRDSLGVIKDTTNQSFTYYPLYEWKRINRYSHDPSPLIAASGEKNLFIQGLGGNYATIKIDTTHLYAWKDSLFKTTPRYGISNIELILEVDTLNSDIKKDLPFARIQVELKKQNGEFYDKPYFKYGRRSGYVFQYNTDASVYYALYDNSKYNYHLKLNPYYFEAFMAFKNNPQSPEFGAGGKYEGFLTKDKYGEYLYVYELDELVLRPFNSDINMNRVVLKGTEHNTSPLKLKVKYFTFQ